MAKLRSLTLVILSLLVLFAVFVALLTLSLPVWLFVPGLVAGILALVLFVGALCDLESHFPSWGTDTATHLN